MSDARITPGGLRQLGLVNWSLCRVASWASGVKDIHLFSTLGRHRSLLRGWLVFSAQLMPFGKLSRHETELVILRVGHLRGCDYELDHHTRIGERVGVTPEVRERVFAGPAADGWSDRHRALLRAVDMLSSTKDLDDATWSALASHFDERQLVELVLLVGQYEMLATAIGTLRITRDIQA